MTALEVILILVGLHVFGLLVACVIVLPLIRADRKRGEQADDDESDGGWGNEPVSQPKPSRWPGGGVPLPDATQSSVRLRAPGRIATDLSRPARRPAHAPTPHRSPIHH